MPPATGDRRWRGGRADRRQIQVLVLTARYLRRRRGPTASVFGRMPLASDPPHLPISANQRSIGVCSWYSNMRKAAILRKPCEFRKQKLHGTKFQGSAIFASGVRAQVRPSNRGASFLAIHLVLNKRRSRPSANAHRLTSSGRS